MEIPKPTVISNKNTVDFYQNAADLLEEGILYCASTQDKVVLALCGGRSVAQIFVRLAEKKELPWKKVHIFMVDDRVLPLDDPESNFKLVFEYLIKPLEGIIPMENIHPYIIDTQDDEYGVSNYTKEIAKLGNRFDVSLLSIGEDGHVGGLYPNHHSILEPHKAQYIYMDDSPKDPPKRITATRALIETSRYVVLMALGESKQKALNELLTDEVDVKSTPAKLIYKIRHANILTDQPVLI